MWKNFNFVTKYFTKRRQRYITKTIAMNQQEFQLREITYQDIKDLLAIEREVYAGGTSLDDVCFHGRTWLKSAASLFVSGN